MGFSFRVAKGLRVRVSSRGVRTSIGPRQARLHFGSGSPGVSTGVGPFGFYKSLGAGRRGGGRSAASTTSATQRQKLADAHQLEAIFRALDNLHRGEFQPAQPPSALPPPPVNERQIREHYEAQALAGIGFFKRKARRATKERAAATATADIDAQRRKAEDERLVLQAQLDEHWQRLLRNEPDVVLATLEEAFEDNEAPAAAVSVDGDEVGVVVVIPGIESVPERIPATTDAGNLTLRKLSKAERAGLYGNMACGHLLATVREVLAVVPNISSVRAAVLRFSAPDSYGKRQLDCLLAARFARKSFDGVLWESTDALQIVSDTATDQLFKISGRTKEFEPLDLAQEPELAALMEQVDLSELSE